MKTKMLSVVFWLSFMLSGTSAGSNEIKPIAIGTDTGLTGTHSADVAEMLEDLIQSSHVVIHVDPELEYSYPEEFFWLIETLQKEQWIRKIVYGGLPDNLGQSCQLHFIDTTSDNMEYLVKEELNLLKKIQQSGPPLYGWGQNRLPGKERESTFQSQYPDHHRLRERQEQIANIISETGIRELQKLFGMVHPGPAAIILESQVNHDESAAYFCSESGTVLIMPRLYHASRIFGVPKHLAHNDPDNRVRSIQFTLPKQEGTNIHGRHFDYWLVPSTK